MIDTAHLYTGGASEQTIGRALSPIPPGVVVATKGGYGGAGRGRPEVLREEIEESLKRLRVDCFALYYLHRVAAVQNEYNISERKYDDVVDYCTREGIVFVPFYPLHGESSRALRETAKRHGATERQLMLACCSRARA